MSNWQKHTISELCNIKVSGVDKKIYPNEIPVKLCNYMDAYRNDYLNNKTNYSIGSVNQNELRKFSLVKNDVIITKDSETPEDIAVSSVVIEDLENVVCGYHLAILQPNEKIDGTFLMHSLKLPSNQRLFYRIASGSTRYGLTIGGIEGVTLSIPSIPYQQKIAKILSTCDTVISQTEQAIKKYEAIKQGMMMDLFTRGIDVDTGKLRPSYEDQPDLYKESELGWIPKDWKVKSISSFADVVTGSTPSTTNQSYYDGQFMFISPSDISNQKYIYQAEKTLTKLGLLVSRVIPTGSICVVCIGSTIGKIALTTSDSTTNQQINSIVPYNKALSEFVFYASKQYLNDQLKVEAGLQAVPIVNKSSFEKLLLPLCNDSESKIITERLTVLDCKIDIEKDTLKKYQQIKAGLMQDLLTGKVQVQTDEVA